MSTPTKSSPSDLFTLVELTAGQYLPAPGTSPLTVTTKMGAGLTVYFAPTGTGASPPATEWGLEKKVNTAGADQYTKIQSFFSPNTQSVSTAVSSGGTTGQNKCVVAALTGIAVGAVVFFKNSTFSNSEWKKIVAIDTGTKELTFSENFENTQTTSTLYTGADIAYLELDLTVIKQGVRFFVDNNRGPALSLTNRTVGMKAVIETLDSFD